MLARRRTGGTESRWAVTGPPAWARAMFSPTARSSVLLPAMFEPVTMSAVPAPRRETSLATRRGLGQERVGERLGLEGRALVGQLGQRRAPVDPPEGGQARQGLQLPEGADRLLQAVSHARRPRLQAPQDVEVPAGREVDEEVHRELGAELREPGPPIEPRHGLRGGRAADLHPLLYSCEQRRLEARRLDHAQHLAEGLDVAPPGGDEIEDVVGALGGEHHEGALDREHRAPHGVGERAEPSPRRRSPAALAG